MQSYFVSRAAYVVAAGLIVLSAFNSFGKGVDAGTFFTPPPISDAGISAVHSPNGSSCAGPVSFSVELHNYGPTPLTSADIIWDIDSGGSTTFSWAGTLASGSSTTINLGSAEPGNGSHTFNVSSSNPNGTADANTANDGTSSSFEVYDTFVDVYITTDYYPSETTWVILNEAFEVIASGGPYSASSTLQPVETVCLYSSKCYNFVIYDLYGDGIC